MPYSGRYHKGYNRTLREIKRQEADERNARTVPERRASYRRLPLSERTGLTPEQRATIGDVLDF